MRPQFVDFNADGHLDIVTATFDGSPHVAYGSAKGFAEPQWLTDASGSRIMLRQYWDDEAMQWKGNEEQPEGHCTSATAFDWDGDGDFDLLIGSYGDGKLYRQMNEGKPGEPKFTGKNIPIEAGGKPIAIDGGITTPIVIDFDRDGRDDLICGGFGDTYQDGPGGGVWFFRNTSKSGAPEFAAPVTLIPASPKGAQEPTRPDSGLYPWPVDVDGDGDLDLIVGGYSHVTPPPRELNEDEKARASTLESAIEKVSERLNELVSAAFAEVPEDATPEQQQEILSKVFESDEHKKLREERSEMQRELESLVPRGKREPYVWLYRCAGEGAGTR